MGVPYLPSLLLAVAFGFLLGVMTDLIAFRPLKNANIISLVLATIGVAFVLRGTARVIWGGKGDYLPFPPITSPEPVMIGEIMVIPQQLAVLAGAIVIMVVFAAFFRLTRAGKMMQATADNAKAATLAGIRVDRIYMLAFGTGAAIAGAAAVLMAPLTLLYPDMGFAFFIKGFAAAVLGGLTSLPGAVLGGHRHRHHRSAGRRLPPFELHRGVGVHRHHVRARRASDRTAWRHRLAAGLSMALFGRRNVLLAMLVFAAVAPAFLNAYYLFVANTILIYVLLSIGLNILVGYTGQLAFANAAMFGIGAYGTGLLQVHFGWPFWLAFPSGALIATAVGLAISLPALRLRGLYLALSTLAFAQFTQWVFLNWEAVTFGAGGFKTPPISFAPLPISKPFGLYYLSSDPGAGAFRAGAESRAVAHRPGLRRGARQRYRRRVRSASTCCATRRSLSGSAASTPGSPAVSIPRC